MLVSKTEKGLMQAVKDSKVNEKIVLVDEKGKYIYEIKKIRKCRLKK